MIIHHDFIRTIFHRLHIGFVAFFILVVFDVEFNHKMKFVVIVPLRIVLDNVGDSLDEIQIRNDDVLKVINVKAVFVFIKVPDPRIIRILSVYLVEFDHFFLLTAILLR